MRSGVDETLCGIGERLIKRRAQSRAPGVFYRVGRNRFGRVRLGKRDAETRADRSRGRRKIESGALSATGKRFSARRGLCAARGRSGEAFGRWFDRARPCALADLRVMGRSGNKKRARPFERTRGCVALLEGALRGSRVVSVSAVGFSHTMDVFTLGESDALLVVSVDELGGEFLRGRLAFLIADGHEDPADAQGLGASGVDRSRDLIGGAADALGTNFRRGLDVFDRLREDFDRFDVLNFGRDFIESVVEDLASGVLLAVPHQAVDELAREDRIELRIAL